MHRRDVLIGAAGLSLAAQAAKAQPQGAATEVYEYLFLLLKPGGSRPAFMTHLTGEGRKAVTAAGGAIVGVFTPQLGWDSNELAVLIRWSGADRGRTNAVTTIQAAPQAVWAERHTLTPTARPRPADQLRPGGIYVHRWFEIRPADREEFIRLSSDGWVDFEKRFASNIFGLFADISPRPGNSNLWLLLLTRYADHGVWEASRDPATEAMRSFQRRAQLTMSSRGCSTLLAALPT